MSSGPVVPMVWEGDGVVKAGRVLLGATKPSESAPGSIRGDFCIDVGRNICEPSPVPRCLAGLSARAFVPRLATLGGDFRAGAGHGSDAVESANNEIAMWFKPEELVDWKSHSESWVYEK
jgi:nucleoside-diphosphate kinase